MADQISDSTKLEVTRTSRGFAVAMGVDLYAEPYSIQDSSLAEEAAIWLGRDADTGGRAHLTQDMAAGLIPLLQAFVVTGSIAGPADTIAAPPKWRERWYGSEPQKGSAVVDERGNLIAHLGGDEATHAAVTRIVTAHNATLFRQGEGLKQQAHEWRRREVQAIGAAISTRSWHAVEQAYNALRDKMDAAGCWHAPATPKKHASDGGKA